MKKLEILLACAGTMLVALGVVCVLHPVETLSAIAWLIGLLMFCSGAFSLVFSLRAQQLIGNAGTMTVRSLLMIILGGVVLCNNTASVALIPLVCACWVIFDGLSLTVQSFDFKKMKFPHWWAILVLGIGGVVLGCCALRDPAETGKVISILIGIAIILEGLNRFVMLAGVCRVHKAIADNEHQA